MAFRRSDDAKLLENADVVQQAEAVEIAAGEALLGGAEHVVIG